jgi:hypothetical protein
MFHKMYQGRQPLAFVYTGLYQGRWHYWYGVHNKHDLVWAQQLDRVLKHHIILHSTPTSTVPKQDAARPPLVSRHLCNAAARYNTVGSA